MRLRTTISGLMVAIVVIAVGFAALKNPTVWWASGLFTLEVGLLGTAILTAILRRGRARAGCLGFSVFGILYLHVNYSMLRMSERYQFPPLLFELVLSRYPVDGPPGHNLVDENFFDNLFYTQVLCSLGALVFAGLGAMVGRFLDPSSSRP